MMYLMATVGGACRQCKGQKTIRESSFFSQSKLSLQKWLFVLILCAKDTPITDAIDDARIDSRTGVEIHIPVVQRSL